MVLYSIKIKGNPEHNNEFSLDICLLSTCSLKDDLLICFFYEETHESTMPKTYGSRMALPQWLRIGQLLLIRFYTDKIHFSSEVHALKLMVTKKSNMVPLK